MNTVYEKMHQGQPSDSKIGPFKDEEEMMRRYNDYRKSFKGNAQTAQQQIIQLIRSGRVSPQMLQYAQGLMNRFYRR